MPGKPSDSSELVGWLAAKRSAAVDGVEVRASPGRGRGLFATRDRAAGEVLLGIPRSAWVLPFGPGLLPIASGLPSLGLELRSTAHSVLALQVLEARGGAASGMGPYYESLPGSFEALPLFWSAAEREFLRGSWLLEAVRRQEEEIASDYGAVTAAMEEAGQFSPEEFRWARCVVLTRGFWIRVGGRRTVALAPVADILNHGTEGDVTWSYDDDEERLVVRSTRPLAAGAEIHDSYRGSNADLLFAHGFTMGCEDEDMVNGREEDAHSVVVSVSVDGGERRLELTLDHASERSRRTSSMLRAISDSAGDAQVADDDGAFVAPISAENEIRVLDRLAEACAVQLAEYERSLADDLEELRSPTCLDANRRNALVVLAGEKLVCAHYQELAAIVRESLAAVREPSPGGAMCPGAVEAYVADVVRPLLGSLR